MRAAALLAVITAAAAANATYFYGGDFDNRNGAGNYSNGEQGQTSRTYDDFAVTGQPITVTSVWSNNLMDTAFTATTALVEIRSGVSSGNPGALVFSGTFPAAITATGRTGFGMTEKEVRVSGLSVNLAVGTYHLSVTPIGNGAGYSFVSSTSGANGAGGPRANGNSFIDSAGQGLNFSPATFLGTGTWDFSMGVDTGGAVATVEPNSFNMVRGIVLSGGLQELRQSDDQRLVIRPGIVFSTTEAPIQLEVLGTAPQGSVTELKFVVEAHVNQGNIQQRIALYNYQTNAYEQLDARAGTTTDSIVEVTVATNAGRFIEPNTREMKSKVSYITTGPVFSYPWQARVDQTIWRITQ